MRTQRLNAREAGGGGPLEGAPADLPHHEAITRYDDRITALRQQQEQHMAVLEQVRQEHRTALDKRSQVVEQKREWEAATLIQRAKQTIGEQRWRNMSDDEKSRRAPPHRCATVSRRLPRTPP